MRVCRGSRACANQEGVVFGRKRADLESEVVTFCMTPTQQIITMQRLPKRREEDRERRARVRAEETPEQREERLARRREEDRERRARVRAEETPEQREQRLARRREEARERRARVRAEETPEQREQKLARQREEYRERRARVRAEETPEQRQQTLGRRREQDRECRGRARAEETPEQRELRLARQREQARLSRSNSKKYILFTNINYRNYCKSWVAIFADTDETGIQDPLFEQHAVRCKMSSFHSKLMSLEFHHCTTCLECFSDLTMAAGSTECRRCTQDKHIPKLYSTANNMNPGVVPHQLQVHKQVTHIQIF